jgi:hypothetical protein
MIGTSAISSNSNIASAALPTGVRVSVILSTSAVEDSASASPRASAVGGELPRIISPIAISRAQPNSSFAPSAKTCRRIAHSRPNDSSSPTENSNRMIPNSANGASRAGSLIVT